MPPGWRDRSRRVAISRVGKGALFAPCRRGYDNGGHAEPVIGPAEGRTRWLCPPYSPMASIRTMRASGPRGRQFIVPEAFAKRHFLDLAGRGVGNFVDENHVMGHRAGGDLPPDEARYVLVGSGFARFHDDDKERPLVPFGMANADQR